MRFINSLTYFCRKEEFPWPCRNLRYTVSQARFLHISQLFHVQKPRETDVMSPHFANYCTVQRNRERYPERAAKWQWSGVSNLDLLTIGLPWFTQTHGSELDRRHVYDTKHYRSLASLIPESHRLPQTTAPMSYVVLLIF